MHARTRGAVACCGVPFSGNAHTPIFSGHGHTNRGQTEQAHPPEVPAAGRAVCAAGSPGQGEGEWLGGVGIVPH
eukprot:scaffold34376_cov23-Tisochrysis_lutea.AAC.1